MGLLEEARKRIAREGAVATRPAPARPSLLEQARIRVAQEQANQRAAGAGLKPPTIIATPPPMPPRPPVARPYVQTATPGAELRRGPGPYEQVSPGAELRSGPG